MQRHAAYPAVRACRLPFASKAGAHTNVLQEQLETSEVRSQLQQLQLDGLGKQLADVQVCPAAAEARNADKGRCSLPEVLMLMS